jgi:hypothetical protein
MLLSGSRFGRVAQGKFLSTRAGQGFAGEAFSRFVS